MTEEHNLKAQREYLQQVIDTIPHQLFAKDRQGRFTLINQASSRWLGLPPAAVVGKTDAEINPCLKEVERFQRQDQEIFSAARTIVLPENPLTSPATGELRWFETIKRPLLDAQGRPVQVVGISTDLTERKRSHDALRALVEGTAPTTAEDYFRSLAYHLAAVLNTKCALVAELSSPHHNTLNSLAFIAEGDFKEDFKLPLEGSAGAAVVGSPLQFYPERVAEMFPSDPLLRQYNIQSYLGVPILGANGRTLGVLAVMDDKPLPEWPPQRWILTIFAARAGAEIERLTAEAERDRLQLELLHSQKMEIVGEVSAGIAHDLNNSLAAIRGHLELIESEGQVGDLERKSVGIALQGCSRASALIDQLLGFSRNKAFHLEELVLNHLTAQTLEFLSSLLDRGITVEIQGDREPLLVRGDAAQLQQALTNIIINAHQAMPTGGRLLLQYRQHDLSRLPPKSNPATGGSFISLAISDNGCGIPPEIQSKIFDPFFTTKGENGGTGLGLATALRIVERHGGWLEVESEPGRGTTCTIFLPAAAAATKPSSPAATAAAFPRPCIVVIDDEPFLVDLCLTFLRRSGFHSFGFTVPEEALLWFQEHGSAVDLVILDMKMPRIGGEECFHCLRRMNAQVPILVLTGYIQHEALQRLQDQENLDFLRKPVKYPELMEWIKNRLNQPSSAATHPDR